MLRIIQYINVAILDSNQEVALKGMECKEGYSSEPNMYIDTNLYIDLLYSLAHSDKSI